MKADAFGGVLVDDRQRVLLREPAGHFGGYVWTFAKGRPDPGETPEQTALREVREETGYDATIVARLPTLFGGSTTRTRFYLMRPRGAPAQPSSETASVIWCTWDEAGQRLAQSTLKTGRERDLAVLREAREVLDACSREVLDSQAPNAG